MSQKCASYGFLPDPTSVTRSICSTHFFIFMPSCTMVPRLHQRALNQRHLLGQPVPKPAGHPQVASKKERTWVGRVSSPFGATTPCRLRSASVRAAELKPNAGRTGRCDFVGAAPGKDFCVRSEVPQAGFIYNILSLSLYIYYDQSILARFTQDPQRALSVIPFYERVSTNHVTGSVDRVNPYFLIWPGP